MKTNKEGFTLIELLAVIAILAILLLLAVPKVIGYYNNAKDEAFLIDAQAIIKAAEVEVLSGKTGEIPLNELNVKTKSNYSGRIVIPSESKSDVSTYKLYLTDGTRKIEDSTLEDLQNKRVIKSGGEFSGVKLLQTEILKETAYADNVNSPYVQNETPGIDYTAISSPTNGQGLYYTSTNTESTCEVGDVTYVSPGVCKTYFYRGAVENNYVSFAGELWRIVRINEDGSIRIILNDKLANDNAFQLESVDMSKRNMYMPDNEVVSGSAADALNTWYNTTLSTSEKAKVSTDAIYCNDMSIGRVDSNRTYFGAGTRLSSSTPQFLCPQKNDKLVSTSSTLNASNVNKVLVQPVGLITADEVMYSGGSWLMNPTWFMENPAFYLYRPSYRYWTLSPYYVPTTNNYARSFDVRPEIGLYGGYDDVWVAYGIVPVITLKSDVAATGSGTSDDPYVITE